MSRRTRSVGLFRTRHGVEWQTLVQSIQRGTIAVTGTSATATITAVRTGRTIVNFLGVVTASTSTAMIRERTRLTLTNATTVTGTRDDGTDTMTVRYEVVEYLPGTITVQRGTISMTTGTSRTATITAVITRRSYLVWCDYSTTGLQFDESKPDVSLTNATTVTATRNSTTLNVEVDYQVVEW